MHALCVTVAVILALTNPAQGETPKGGPTLVAGLSGHAPSVGNGLPKLPRLPTLPRLPRVPRP